METIISALSRLVNKKIEYDIIGMRPGEKIHEDMLAKTELAFTHEATDGLLVVLPQYTKKKYSYKKKYHGEKMNSALHLNKSVDYLKDLLKRGIDEAN